MCQHLKGPTEKASVTVVMKHGGSVDATLDNRSIRSSRGRDDEFPRSGNEVVLDEAKR